MNPAVYLAFFLGSTTTAICKHTSATRLRSSELKGLNDGQIEIDLKANWTEMEVRSDGRTLKARFPASLCVYPTGETDSDSKARVLVTEGRRQEGVNAGRVL